MNSWHPSSAQRCRLIAAAVLTFSVGIRPGLLRAQTEVDPTEDASYQFGALAFTPALVFSTGYDTNVYRERQGFADYETFVVPQIQGWWTQPGFRVSAQAAAERVNFRHNVGATNAQIGARIDRINALITPYLSWDRRRTNAGPTGFEAGYKSLRLEDDLASGLRAPLTPRSHVNGLIRLVRTRWDADARYQTSSLREKLNRDTLSAVASFGYTLTRLTAVGASVEIERDRFQFSPIRDGNTLRIAPTLDFAPAAFLFGTARIGYEQFRSPASGAADFNGLFGSVNLGYGLPGGTLLKALFTRDVEFSYDPALAYYVSTNLSLTAAHRIAGRWDAAAFTGRYLLDFRPPQRPLVGRPVDVVSEIGGAIAYRIRTRTRVGWTIEHAQKTGVEGFQAFRMVGFMTFGSGRFQRLDRPTPFER